jgi:2-polyprenyl-3-methyl-5-hydroxy-6-metoxy-1,4-benzoquinol methylase
MPMVKVRSLHHGGGDRSDSDLWNTTFETKSADERSWSQDVPTDSLFYIGSMHLDVGAAIIDVGGGSSTLVDELRARSFTDLTVLDISSSAIQEARDRINDDRVKWLHEDITIWEPKRKYALWHDRAVFHFLLGRDRQLGYVTTAASSIIPGGHLLLATFSPSGPHECSGLAVQRWSDHELEDLFSNHFTMITSALREHVTPWGSVQPFTWALLQRHSN